MTTRPRFLPREGRDPTMTEDDSVPAIVRLGAGSDESVKGVNLDVSGTVGPDYLGQETVTVDGHPYDRPGVQSRLPESGRDDPRIRRMDTGEELPVLLSSSMSADPCEGVQGSYTTINEGECSRCGYDRLRVTVHTLAGEATEVCNACGARQTREGYSMPTTDEERAKREREAGERIADLSTHAAVDLEHTTGSGPYVSLVGKRSVTRLRKSEVAGLFFQMVERDDFDLAEEVSGRYDSASAVALAVSLLPDRVSIELEDE